MRKGQEATREQRPRPLVIGLRPRFSLEFYCTVMSSTVSVEIPREVLHASRMTEEELRRELALHLFEEDKLSFGKARELAEMSVWDFQHLLGSRGILVHHDVEAYESDRETLSQLGRI